MHVYLSLTPSLSRFIANTEKTIHWQKIHKSSLEQSDLKSHHQQSVDLSPMRNRTCVVQGLIYPTSALEASSFGEMVGKGLKSDL